MWKRKIGQKLSDDLPTENVGVLTTYGSIEMAIKDAKRIFCYIPNIRIVRSDESDTITHILSYKEAKRILKLNQL
jgi:hypothetical protein